MDISQTYPVWAWVVFFVVVLTALFVDIGIVNRRSHTPSRKETLAWSLIWVSLAFVFGAFVFYQFGGDRAKLFFTGYLIELSLSIDNLFVFLLIFSYFRVPKKFQHRALFWGIFMALVLRLVMIFAGAQLVERFEWLLYLFGAFLIYTGIKMFDEDEGFNPEASRIVKLTTRILPISEGYQGDKFIIRENGKRMGTMLLLVLIVINLVDVVFAVDSIPAIFGVTTDRFIVYTSNIFAILGLRTFYFLLAELADRFHLLKYGLAFILSFIGVKMLLPLLVSLMLLLSGGAQGSSLAVFLHRWEAHEFDRIAINVSLAVVLVALGLSITLSLIFPAANRDDEASDQGG
ncbi:MAG TPA: TerC family protein [Pyrinomonadaceae bacterium]|jgi:tellurite resistance protein TerC|nr:TerC family protein [Pyrinomonadaceae bacterium]